MDDIFKSKDDEQREEKINNLFKSSGDFKKTESETVSEDEAAPMAETGKKRKTFWIILGVLFILGLLAAAGYWGWKYKKNMGNSETAANETQAITEKIAKFMDLPPETPTLATITDKDKLSDQTFFTNAQNGDKVLIYTQSKKAILYRPETSRVIEFTLLKEKSAEATTPSETKSAEPAPEKIENKVKVDVLNGTEIKGLAKETADKLSGMENVELAKVGNTQKSDYKKIIVVDVSEKNAAAAKIIAQKLGGEVGSLPAGENKGTADILIIAGK